MKDQIPQAEADTREIPWKRVVLWAVGACAVLYTTAAWMAGATKLVRFAQLGDSLGPLGTLLSAIAVVAAIYSVDLQRKELADNRRELIRAADAQEKLASSQAELAVVQRNTVREATAQRLATYALTTSILEASVAGVQAQALHARQTATKQGNYDDHWAEIPKKVERRAVEANAVYEQLRALVEKGNF